MSNYTATSDYNYLQGGNGDNTYIINPAEINAPSYTTIRDYGSASDNDRVVFEGISSNDVTVWADNNGHIYIDFKGYSNNHVKLDYQHDDINRIALFQFADGVLTFDQFVDRYLRVNDIYYSTSWLNKMYGIGKVIQGVTNNSKIYGGTGNDVLIAGAGNNFLQAEAGNDTYVIDPAGINAPSYTTIRDYGLKTDNDKVVFKGISSNDVTVWADNNGNIFIDFKDYANNHVKLEYQHEAVNRVALLEFSDGVMTFGQFADKFLKIDDSFYSTPWLNKINDIGKVLQGVEDNSKLYGGNGNDILIAGQNNNFLQGAAGNDIYIVDPASINGPSSTTIRDYGLATDSDKIIFKGVSSDDVTVWADNNGHIYIDFKNYAGNHVKLEYQLNDINRAELFEFSDRTMTFEQFANKYLKVIYGVGDNHTLQGTPFSEKLFGGSTNDILIAGPGTDYLCGSEGDDTYVIDPASIKGPSSTTIRDYGLATDNDKVVFKGISSESITARADSNGHIYIDFNDYAGNHVKLEYQHDIMNRTALFEFSDKTLTFDQFAEKFLKVDSILYSTPWLNKMYGIGKVLYGVGSNDKLYGGTGNDIFYAGHANNFLQGAAGNDNYVINPASINGPSYTTIRDYGLTTDSDRVIFQGISSKDVTVWADNNGNIFVDFKDYADNHVKLEYQHDAVNKTALFEFSDKTLTFDEFTEKFLKVSDTLYSAPWLNKMYGIDGKVFYGSTNDTIWGSTGSDLYIFNPGDGKDIVNDPGGNDTIRINGVDSDDIALYINDGGQLVIKYSDNDQITVQGQLNADKAIERLEIGNNLYMTNIDINNLIQDMSAYATENGIQLTNVDDIRNNAALTQLVSNAWHS